MDKISSVCLCVGANPYSSDAFRKTILSASERVEEETKDKHEEIQQLSLAVQQLIPLEMPTTTSAISASVYSTDDVQHEVKLGKRSEFDTHNSLHGSTSLLSKKGYHARSTSGQVLTPTSQLDLVNAGLRAVDTNEIVTTKNQDSNSNGHELRASISPQIEEEILQLPLQENFTEMQHRLCKGATNLIDCSGLELLAPREESVKARQFFPQLQDNDKVLDSSLRRLFVAGQSQHEATTMFRKEGEKVPNSTLIYNFKAWGDQHAVRISHQPGYSHSQLMLQPSSNLVEQRLNDQVNSSGEAWVVQPHQDEQQEGRKPPWAETEEEEQ